MTHELLTPRYKVEADYPNSPFKVGDILMIEKHELHEFVRHGHLVTLHSTIQQYPHLFRRMNWWEQRQIDDMPEYVKCVDSDCTEYFKVTDWVFSEEENCLCKVDDDVYTGIGYDYEGNITPATETEYLDYLKNNL